MSGVVSVHQRLAVAILVLGLVGAVGAAFGAGRRQVSPTLRAYLWLTAGVVVLQAALGAVLAVAGRRPHQSLHFIYGPAVLLALPVALVLGAARDERGEAYALLAGSVAVFLLAFRAIGTGGS